MPLRACTGGAAEDDDGAPWHDQTLPLAERMKLAEGRPLQRRMMAAMAQQDCGQCGYNCQDYSSAAFLQEGGAAQSLRARRQGDRPHAQDALPGARQPVARFGADAGRDPAGGCRCFGCAGRRCPAARATIPLRRSSCRARGSTSRARPRRPGISSSISPARGIDYAVGDSLRSISRQRSGAGRRGARGARRAGGFPDRRAHAARRADRRRLAVAGARHAVPACSPTSPAANGGRRRKALAAGEDPDGDAAALDVLAAIEKFRRRAARSGSLHRGARSAAAAALFDLVLAEVASRPRLAHASMRCATRSRQAHAPRRRLDLPRRPRRRPATRSRSTCRRRTPSGCRPIRRCRSS